MHRPFSKVFAVALSVLMFMSSVTVSIATYATSSDYTSYLESVKAELERMDSDGSSITNTDLETVLDTVCEAGEEMSRLQNLYLSASSEELGNIAEAADALLSQEDKDARVPWLTSTYSGVEAEWVFEKDLVVSSSSFPVIWVCYSKGDVAAIATAMYDVDEAVFFDVRYRYTYTWYSENIPAT